MAEAPSPEQNEFAVAPGMESMFFGSDSELQTMLHRATKHYRHHSYSRALPLLRDVVEAAPDNARAWRYLSATLFELQEYEEALVAARQVVFLRPDDPVSHCNLGTILRKLGRLLDARDAQTRALGLRPGYPRALVEIEKLDRVQFR